MKRKQAASKKKSRSDHFEVMDTTLRDGEQTQGVSIRPEEKRRIAQMLLEDLRVDRIEVASARVSKGEHTAVESIMKWAAANGYVQAVEVLGFVDHQQSVDWVASAGAQVINLLTKGSRKHCEGQLGKTLAQHLADIEKTVAYGITQGMKFNIYLEDWSNGMLTEPAYVHEFLETITTLPFQRIMFPDTLGTLSPNQVRDFITDMRQLCPQHQMDFHAHNDYGLAVANTLEGVLAGAKGVHCTINGLGERAGNAPLDEVVAVLRDHAGLETGVDEKQLKDISRWVEIFTGKRIAANKPISGDDVFTQTAGIHADGDKKGQLYFSRLSPERFGRQREYALGKLIGKASLEFNLKRLNIELSPDEFRLVQQRVIELGDKKQRITVEDLPFIISDILAAPDKKTFSVENCVIISSRGMKPVASVQFRYRDKLGEQAGSGDGGYDAFMQALRLQATEWNLTTPMLLDYEVHIPPGGRSDALVETTITWDGGFKTRGVNSDQVMAAIEATEKAVNLLLSKTFIRDGKQKRKRPRI